MKGAGGLIVMGGGETAYKLDRYPYLRDEIHLIENALAEGKPVLGICLGSQLLAAALGANVRRGDQREIGWYPVRLNDAGVDDRLMGGLAREFMAAHWHSDTFDLPAGATALASSDITEIQAFRHGNNAYGIQFHAEMTHEILAALVAEFGDGLKRVGIDGDAIAAQAETHLPKLEAIGAQIFSRWAKPIQGT
jgi:GMP synthase (glutamine-hydrolysing)